jgi:RimJ/RimL family protein N-acetyltransferase
MLLPAEMRHDLSVEGLAYCLRPVRREDAAFIVSLRSDPQHSRYLHPVPPDIGRQEAWLEAYFDRAGDWYFVIERRAGTAEGMVGIYNLDSVTNQAEWGRWVLKPGSLGAPESAWLVYRAAFERIALERLYCRTVADNQHVVSFHDSCGLERGSLLPGHFELNGKRYAALEHWLTRTRWEETVAPRLAGLVERLAYRLNHA